jgi:hypothetical protein
MHALALIAGWLAASVITGIVLGRFFHQVGWEGHSGGSNRAGSWNQGIAEDAASSSAMPTIRNVFQK